MVSGDFQLLAKTDFTNWTDRRAPQSVSSGDFQLTATKTDRRCLVFFGLPTVCLLVFFGLPTVCLLVFFGLATVCLLVFFGLPTDCQDRRAGSDVKLPERSNQNLALLMPALLPRVYFVCTSNITIDENYTDCTRAYLLGLGLLPIPYPMVFFSPFPLHSLQDE